MSSLQTGCALASLACCPLFGLLFANRLADHLLQIVDERAGLSLVC